jgi:hypothetical protein
VSFGPIYTGVTLIAQNFKDMFANSQSSKLAGDSGENKVSWCHLSGRIRLFFSVKEGYQVF